MIAQAIALADETGLVALTMRRLGEALGVEAMSLYTHVAHKEDLLDGMIDAVFAEIELPGEDEPWQLAMRRRTVSARAVLARHGWAVALMDSRANPGPATLGHHDAVLGCLRRAGFSAPLAGRAVSLLDSYLYGFVLQEQALPFDTPAETVELAEALVDGLGSGYSNLTWFTTERVLRPGYSYAAEFEPGLDLILDGLERASAAER